VTWPARGEGEELQPPILAAAFSGACWASRLQALDREGVCRLCSPRVILSRRRSTVIDPHRSTCRRAIEFPAVGPTDSACRGQALARIDHNLQDLGAVLVARRPSGPDAKQELNRWLPLVKWLLAIPRYILLVFLWIAAVVPVIIAWFAILFTGRYPRGLFDFVLGVFRWTNRVVGYAGILVTDEYPPFRLNA
jgi:hypothetical protein